MRREDMDIRCRTTQETIKSIATVLNDLFLEYTDIFDNKISEVRINYQIMAYIKDKDRIFHTHKADTKKYGYLVSILFNCPNSTLYSEIYCVFNINKNQITYNNWFTGIWVADITIHDLKRIIINSIKDSTD